MWCSWTRTAPTRARRGAVVANTTGLELLIERMKVLQKLLGQVAVKVTTRDALNRLLVKAMMLTVTTEAALRFSVIMLAIMSPEATFAMTLEVGTSALEPTVMRKETVGVKLLVGWFRRATPTELSK